MDLSPYCPYYAKLNASLIQEIMVFPTRKDQLKVNQIQKLNISFYSCGLLLLVFQIVWNAAF